MKITHRFYLREPLETDTKAPVYMQITADRRTTKRTIGYDLFSKEWDFKKESAKLNHAVNSRIQQLKSKLLDLQFEIQKNPQEISVKQIADQLFKTQSNSSELLSYFELRMENENERGIYSKGTFKHYKSCLNLLKVFIQEQFKSKDILLVKIDLRFIELLDTFLVKRNLKINTINSNYHKKLKSTLSNAVKQDLIEKNPYESFKLKQVSTKRDFLSKQELLKLQSFDFSSNIKLDRVRDLFVFSCYTGLRYSDAQALHLKDIHHTDEGSFIYRKQNKTDEIVHIPLHHEMLQIINKYDNDESKISGKILPQISNQKVNEYIKFIADIIGIQKTLTHHVARHTCAIILLNNGVDISIVRQILGHDNIATTQIYAKVLNKTISTQYLNVFNDINNGK